MFDKVRNSPLPSEAKAPQSYVLYVKDKDF